MTDKPSLIQAFNEMAALPEAEQVDAARRLRDESEDARLEMMKMEEIQGALVEVSPGVRRIDIPDLSESAKEVVEKVIALTAAADDMDCHLYVTSTQDKVRENARATVERVVEEALSFLADDDKILGGAHDVLYLSTYGGSTQAAAWDPEGTTYVFNASLEYGVYSSFMEALEGNGLLVSLADTEGNNLTPRGKAVLQRLNETRGVSEAEREITDYNFVPPSSRPKPPKIMN